MSVIARIRVACLLAMLGSATAGASQEVLAAAPAPKPPAVYSVEFRYRIHAARNERFRQFDELIAYLNSIGFKRNPGSDTEAEDPGENRMSGTIASGQVRQLATEPHIKTILLIPAGFQVPAEGQLKLRIGIVSGMPADRQLLLYEQVRARLSALGFRDNVGYDNRDFSRFFGTFPADELDLLLKDLRTQPSGWLAPASPVAGLPRPLRSVDPVHLIEVIPDPSDVPPARELPAAATAPQEGREFMQKISPALNDLARQEGVQAPQRLEVILTSTPSDEFTWRRELNRFGSDMVIEGRLGPLVTVLAVPKLAPSIAELPSVSTVRLPHPALPQSPLPTGAGEGALQALRASGLMHLHSLGHRGKGVRLAIIDGDFRGYQQFVGKTGSPQLPAGTRYVDFTAERNASIEPDEFASDAKSLGRGTELALAAAAAAPAADMTLIRIDPSAPHQLQAVARFMNGEDFHSESFFHRTAEFQAERDRLSQRRVQLLAEHKVVIDRFTDTRERDILMKKPADKLSPTERELLEEIKRLDTYFREQAAYERDIAELQKREQRFLALRQAFHELKQLQVVASSLVWNDGYPLGGDSALTRYFDDRPFHNALWFQSAGNTRGQIWSGLFRDTDKNGVMEFSAADSQLPAQRWTTELNFMAWQPHAKSQDEDLPAKAKVRIAMQWREAHDPEVYKLAADPYRQPLAKLHLVVLRQRDPTGAKLPGDDLEVIAHSTVLPERLLNEPTFAVYEQSLEFVVEPAGRYALRVEGRVPPGTRPLDLPTLPSTQKSWELRPRIFVDVADPVQRKNGRVIFADFATSVGAMGVPGEAHSLFTVGAANAQGHPLADSTPGPPLHMELLTKPDLFGYVGLNLSASKTSESFGTGEAAAFAAGGVATWLSSGTDKPSIARKLRERQARPIQAP